MGLKMNTSLIGTYCYTLSRNAMFMYDRRGDIFMMFKIVGVYLDGTSCPMAILSQEGSYCTNKDVELRGEAKFSTMPVIHLTPCPSEILSAITGSTEITEDCIRSALSVCENNR